MVLLFLFCSTSCHKNRVSNEDNNFRLIGSVQSNRFESKKVYLKKQELNNLTLMDSTVIKNGKFEFKGKVDRPIVYGVFIEELDGLIGLFMENSIINIEVNTMDLEQSKIFGSKTNDDYITFTENSNKIVSQMNDLFPIFQKARAENDIEKLEEINARMQQINNENTKYVLDYAKKNPDSYIAAVALHSILNIPTVNKDTIAEIYNNFSDYVKQGDFAIQTSIFLENFAQKDSINSNR